MNALSFWLALVISGSDTLPARVTETQIETFNRRTMERQANLFQDDLKILSAAGRDSAAATIRFDLLADPVVGLASWSCRGPRSSTRPPVEPLVSGRAQVSGLCPCVLM